MDGKQVRGICQYCGKEFRERLSPSAQKRRKYCSSECGAKAQWERHRATHGDSRGKKKPNYTGICPQCGKKFSRYIPPIDLVKDIPRCCSTSCKSNYQWKDRKLQISDKTRKCKYCGKEFVYCSGNKSQKYCSLKCANAFATEQAPDNNRILTCKHCGKEFIRDLTDKELANGKGQYCSHQCYSDRFAWEQIYCQQCGKPLKRGCGDKYCSHECAGLGNRRPDGYMTPSGYIMMTIGEAGNGKRIPQHRHVMEQMLERELFDFERVHHKDGNRSNNETSNLEIWLNGHPAGQRLQDIYKKDVERLALKHYNLKFENESLKRENESLKHQLNHQPAG